MSQHRERPIDFIWDTWPLFFLWGLVEYKGWPMTLPLMMFTVIALWMINRIFRRQDALAERQRRLSQLIHFVKDGTPFENIPKELHSASFSEYL